MHHNNPSHIDMYLTNGVCLLDPVDDNLASILQVVGQSTSTLHTFYKLVLRRYMWFC